MKNPVLLLLATAAICVLKAARMTQEQRDKFNTDCLASSEADADAIAKIRSGNFASDPKIHKYFGCMLRSVGVMNQEGQLQVDVLKANAPKNMKKDEGFKLFVACKDKKGGSVDETAYLLYKCFWEQSPSHVKIDGY
ncbi:PBP GOBP domain containing protein [Asbolus verrucosus]|uniref:PBP GOBP domain containing protein n=1 Tax=Asbolus verrucosus TaxID=1661398 RepID=A0A482VB79_ASBVE|nr:PBP GOBP domain containing protein [Asbolus verrucosus]